MPIIVDGEKMKISKAKGENTKFADYYVKCITELKKKFGKSVVIDYPKWKITWAETDKGGRVKETPSGLVFSTKRVLENGGQAYEVQYASSTVVGKDGGIIYSPKTYDFKKKTVIPLVRELDKELAFFLIFVSPFCGRLRGELGKLQNENRKEAYYEVFDEQGIAEDELDVAGRVADVSSLLTSKTFKLPDERAKHIAISYDLMLPGETADGAVLRKRLMDYLLAKNVKGKYDLARIDKFLNDANIPELMEIRAHIKMFIDANVIAQERKGLEMRYVVLSEDLKPVAELCKVNRFSMAEDSLVAHFQDNKKDFNDVKDIYEKRIKKVE